jgi:hypothetical protein
MGIDPDLLDDDFSSAMGTETLLSHDLVPDGLPAVRGYQESIQLSGAYAARQTS